MIYIFWKTKNKRDWKNTIHLLTDECGIDQDMKIDSGITINLESLRILSMLLAC